jgi:hypothetical protein
LGGFDVVNFEVRPDVERWRGESDKEMDKMCRPCCEVLFNFDQMIIVTFVFDVLPVLEIVCFYYLIYFGILKNLFIYFMEEKEKHTRTRFQSLFGRRLPRKNLEAEQQERRQTVAHKERKRCGTRNLFVVPTNIFMHLKSEKEEEGTR